MSEIDDKIGTNADVPGNDTVFAKLGRLYDVTVAAATGASRRVFLESGSWTVPAGVTKILLTACGAGGSGIGYSFVANAYVFASGNAGGTTVISGAGISVSLPGGGGATTDGTTHVRGASGGPGGGVGVPPNIGENTTGITGFAGNPGIGSSGSSAVGSGGGGSLGGGGAGAGAYGGIGGSSMVMPGGGAEGIHKAGKGAFGAGGGGCPARPGGGGAAAIYQKEYTVTPGAVISFTLGKPGASAGTNGTNNNISGEGGNAIVIFEW